MESAKVIKYRRYLLLLTATAAFLVTFARSTPEGDLQRVDPSKDRIQHADDMQESSDEQCVLGDEIVHEGIYSLSPMRPPMDEPMVYEAGAPFEDWEKTAPFVDDEQWDYSFSWPLTEIDISSSYGWRRHPISRRRIFHRGLDIRGQRGHPVMAVAPGMVTFAGWGGRASGRTVAIEHPGGYRSVYCHMFDVNVEPGSFVHKGAVIGLVGSTGRSTGNHLHLEIHKDGRPLNPVRSIGQTVSNRPSPP